MVYDYCITFYLENEYDPFGVRGFFSNHLKKLRLKYKSEVFYPESVWQPDPGKVKHQETSFFLTYSEKQPKEYMALTKDAIKFARSIVDMDKGVIKIGIEKNARHSFLQ